MWRSIIVVQSPRFDLLESLVRGKELIDVQALITQLSVEALYVPVIRRFSRSGESSSLPPRYPHSSGAIDVDWPL